MSNFMEVCVDVKSIRLRRSGTCLLSARITRTRTMGSESDGYDFCDDAIEKVAKANSVRLETTQILPEVSASTCAFHTKSDRLKNELLYMSNHHAGHLPQKRLRPKAVSNIPINPRKRIPKIPSGMDIRQLERDIEKYPKFPSALPGHMPSKEFVMTWLLHGSEPEHHFPELTTPRDKKPSKLKQHKLGAYRNTFVSE
ncbi:uncharacterized protein LOC134691923 isoform X2 [Mytilus trossulus]|uniref:uncharacterized protein LOC134691923 isoform X2 n=1 Tax=Mytilus trossulus TaxID=6551 RepID=UPI00300787CA